MNPCTENPCNQDIFVGRYHDGELEPQRKAEFERHLASCDGCAAHLAELRHVSDAVAHLPLAPMTLMEQMRLKRVADKLGAYVAERAIMRMATSLAALAATLLVITSLWLSAVRASAAPVGNVPQLAVMVPNQTDQTDSNRVNSNLSHWMVRNLGGDLP